ncbi:uncharacterized protein EAE97_006279 [Botrytis byssoidea]|uniref:Uncharacterized protein n=1 Tax=Botrytis byssoidea TaxID=139641 RepID=A0A9P5IIW4_9HELO|nr:uncharacterized protein EAE97_006279 [Botrytis byssoidea]KAF7942825.1 hypothetical protein EAE97_006279 [Botrytis byssoidea]
MTRYGFSQRHRARKEARTLSNPHSPSELPSPWWAPLVKLRRLKLSNETNVPNESFGANEVGGQERVTTDAQNLPSMISSTQNNGLASDDNNNRLCRSVSPASPKTVNDPLEAENTRYSNVILAGDNTAKPKCDKDGQKSSKTITNPVKHAKTTVRGGGNATDKTSGADENRLESFPLRLRTTLESVVRKEELTSGRLTKTWVTRFKDSQKPINPHRRRKYNTKSPKSSIRKRVLRRLEYKNLGIELSYSEVRRADWKPRDHMAVDSRIANTRKPKPGCSNLRYCLTYLKQVQDTVSDLGSSWARDHRQWFSRWGTVRAAALCLGV